jgi:hypothetical protein
VTIYCSVSDAKLDRWGGEVAAPKEAFVGASSESVCTAKSGSVATSDNKATKAHFSGQGARGRDFGTTGTKKRDKEQRVKT